MSETITVEKSAPKALRYQQLLPQIEALIGDDKWRVGALANTAAALHEVLGHLWTGFYLVENNALLLGPFQGPVACMRIPFGKGVCGTAWEKNETIIVPDVDQFPGHIACSSASRSEIVVPVRDASGSVRGVLDIDSADLHTFDVVDVQYLEKLCGFLGEKLY